MIYDHPELIDRLAAQYVLGALRGPARARFERLIATRPDVRRRVGVWESRFAPIAYGLPAVSPPAALRAALIAETRRQPSSSSLPTSPIRPDTAAPGQRQTWPPRWRAVWFRRVRFLAAACACGLLIVGGLIELAGARLSFPAQPPAGRAELAEPELGDDELRPLPVLLARLGMPGSSMGWMISLSPDHRKLAITASDDYLSTGRASVQLWWLADDGAPRPLAILGTERDSTVVVDVPQGLDASRTVVFAITLEPPGGSPTGKPTRPVLDRADRPPPI